jgi:hypothetical protein
MPQPYRFSANAIPLDSTAQVDISSGWGLNG